jgi:hypothetical protein
MKASNCRPWATALGLVILPLFASLLLGCGSAEEERAARARQREWSSLRHTKRALDAERRELTRLRGQLAAAPVGPDGAPTGEAATALAADVAARERRIGARSAALGKRLVRYAAGFARREGEPMPPALQEAIRLKSDEDVEVAQEWIERGGDYRRAIEIYETQRHLDPGYARLEQALARAREMRHVTSERFARVRPEMTRAEVRAALGPVNLRQVLRRPAERLEAWFYPSVGGGRAAVYFRYDEERRAYVVYRTETAAGARRQPAAATS